ncbi:hypothetical protein DRO03_09610 [Methanosarcinales archaeon]|nr:MAG: hypothetical protein DRO03_09610 [Methanosarcinales archaeon]
MIERCFKTGRQCEFELEESPDQVFVGIPFKYPFKDLFEYGVRPALEELGLRPWIAYEHPGSRDIFCKMCEGLCKLLKKHLTQATTKARTYPKVAGYATYREFYRDCSLALDQSSKKADLTHIRDEPPQDFEGVSDWFGEVIKWCDEHPYGKVRRLIAVSNDRMLAWAQELAEYVKNHPNYNFEVRVCQWTANFPAINMVIFDRRRVFIALTGFGATETAGFQVSDRLIADYFVDYYNNIWGKSDDLNNFLDRVAKGEICIDE